MACISNTGKAISPKCSVPEALYFWNRSTLRRGEFNMMILLATKIDTTIAEFLFRSCIAFEIEQIITGYKIQRQ